MKKLMIAACAVALAGAVQAGQCQWKNSSGLAAAGCGDLTQGYTGKIYLMDGTVAPDATATAAETMFKAWVEAGANKSAFETIAAGAMNYATLTTTVDYDTDDGYYQTGALTNPKEGTGSSAITFGNWTSDTYAKLYQIAWDDTAEALYISETITTTKIPAGTGSGKAAFANEAAAEGVKWDVAGGYQGAGWYTAVPEPTSGLLLLLGVAGLALKRRRA